MGPRLKFQTNFDLINPQFLGIRAYFRGGQAPAPLLPRDANPPGCRRVAADREKSLPQDGLPWDARKPFPSNLVCF